MNVLCCVTTHDRLEYTHRTVDSWMDTARGGDRLVIVDNASSDGTAEWLGNCPADLAVLNPRNLFPGAATNIGWYHGLEQWPDCDLLQRSDNDIEYLPGWRDHVDECFAAFPELGQLGILNMHEDFDGAQPVTELRRSGVSVNVQWPTVGGNCVMPRRLWDAGVRWEPGAWQPGGRDEDSQMSGLMKANNLLVARVVPDCANNLSFHRYEDYPDYYTATAELRGLVPELSV